MSHCCQPTVAGWGEGPRRKSRVQLSKSNSPMPRNRPRAGGLGGGGVGGGWYSLGTALLALPRGGSRGRIWGAPLPWPHCTPFSIPPGVPPCTQGHPWVLWAGGDRAPTHPPLILLSFTPTPQSSPFPFAAECPLFLPPRLSQAAFPPPCSPRHLSPCLGGDDTRCTPGDPRPCHGPKGGESTWDPGAWQRRQGPWAGMVTLALAPRRARLGARGPPGRPCGRSVAAEGGVWPRALAGRLPNRGALWDANSRLPLPGSVLF